MAHRKAKTLENQIQFLIQSFSWSEGMEQLDQQVREIGDLLDQVNQRNTLLIVQLQQCITSLGQSEEATSHIETYYHLSSSFASVTVCCFKVASKLQAKVEDEKKRAKLLKGKR